MPRSTPVRSPTITLAPSGHGSDTTGDRTRQSALDRPRPDGRPGRRLAWVGATAGPGPGRSGERYNPGAGAAAFGCIGQRLSPRHAVAARAAVPDEILTNTGRQQYDETAVRAVQLSNSLVRSSSRRDGPAMAITAAAQPAPSRREWQTIAWRAARRPNRSSQMTKLGIRVSIPSFGDVHVKTLCSDFTGTLSLGGELVVGVAALLREPLVDIHVVTSDTNDTAREALAGLPSCRREGFVRQSRRLLEAANAPHQTHQADDPRTGGPRAIQGVRARASC